MSFYSDSPNDLPLLERAQHPVATNPDTRLRDIALARGWRVLELFEQ
jgi:phosphoserine phosphatase